MEHWLHLCWGIDGKAVVSWKKCCTSTRSDYWSSWNTITRNYFRSMDHSVLFFVLFHCIFFLGAQKPLCLASICLMTIWCLITSWFLQVRNEKARKYLMEMRKKRPVPFEQKFPNADPLALRLLQRLLAFDPKDRPTAKEVTIYLL